MFMGNVASSSSANTSFDEMLALPYAHKTLGPMKSINNCSVKTFGFDPNPGMEKHCYCDADVTYNVTLVQEDLAGY
jgi:hypothetical protein